MKARRSMKHDRKKKILFLGNSHTYFNDMPELFRRMCEEGGFCQAEVSMLAFPSVTYEYHLQQETSLRFALVYGNYDILIMQQAAHSPCPSKEETLWDGGKIIRQARRCHTIPMQILPWAEEYRPEHQEEINSIYRELSEKEDVTLIPVGTVLSRQEIEKTSPAFIGRMGNTARPGGPMRRLPQSMPVSFTDRPWDSKTNLSAMQKQPACQGRRTGRACPVFWSQRPAGGFRN